MSHTIKKAVVAVLVALLCLAIFFACVGATTIARWCFAFFVLFEGATIVAAIFKGIDDGELDV